MDTSLLTHACISKKKSDYPQLAFPKRLSRLTALRFSRVATHERNNVGKTSGQESYSQSLCRLGVKRRPEKMPRHSYNPGQFSKFSLGVQYFRIFRTLVVGKAEKPSNAT